LGLKNLSSEKITLCVTNIMGKFDIDQKKCGVQLQKEDSIIENPQSQYQI